ncbi:Hypothetical protein GLP15_4737 [Giardia lamblia P15]|uniref:Uncharacterized protein n=1 Tax=Giardia intestinalis (strain P15) TaxID=658858 RepID=E1F4F5_GIAIA|nr:Hypothetical protein GLP15_4737 [Giardia lamblia P15]
MNVLHPIHGLLTQMSNVTERMVAIVQDVNKHLKKVNEATGFEDATKAIEHARLEQIVEDTTNDIKGNTTSVYTQLLTHQYLADVCEWQFRKGLVSTLADKTCANERTKFIAILSSMSMYRVKKDIRIRNNIQAPIVFSIPAKVSLCRKLAMIETPMDFYRQCKGAFRITRTCDTLLGPCDKPRWRINSSIGGGSTQFDPKLLAVKNRAFGPFKANDARFNIHQERIPPIWSFYKVFNQKRSWFKQPLLIISSSTTFEGIHFSGQVFVRRPIISSIKRKLDNIAITFINCSFGPIKRVPNASFWDRIVSRARAKLQKATVTTKHAVEQELATIMNIREHISGKYGTFLKVSHAQVHVFGSAVVIFKDCHFGPNTGPGIVVEHSTDVIIDGCIFRGHGMAFSAISSVELPHTAAVVCRGLSTMLVQKSLFFLCHCGIASFGENFCSNDKVMTGKEYIADTFGAELKFNTLSPFHHEFMDCYYNNPDGIKELLLGGSLISKDDLSNGMIKSISQCSFQFCLTGIATYGDHHHPIIIADCSIISPMVEMSRKLFLAPDPSQLDPITISSLKTDEKISGKLRNIVTGVQGVGSFLHLLRIVFSEPDSSCIALYECNVDIRDCYCVSAKLYAEDMIDSDLLEYSKFGHLRGKIAPFVLSDRTSPFPIAIARTLIQQLKRVKKQESSSKNMVLKHFKHVDGVTPDLFREEVLQANSIGISLTRSMGTISNVLLATESFWRGLHIDTSAVVINNVALCNCNDGLFALGSEILLTHSMISRQRRSACIIRGTTICVDGQTTIIGAGHMGIGAFQSDIYLKDSFLRDSVTGIRLMDSSSLVATHSAISLMEKGIVISATSAHAIKDVVFSDTTVNLAIV